MTVLCFKDPVFSLLPTSLFLDYLAKTSNTAQTNSVCCVWDRWLATYYICHFHYDFITLTSPFTLHNTFLLSKPFSKGHKFTNYGQGVALEWKVLQERWRCWNRNPFRLHVCNVSGIWFSSFSLFHWPATIFFQVSHPRRPHCPQRYIINSLYTPFYCPK